MTGHPRLRRLTARARRMAYRLFVLEFLPYHPEPWKHRDG